MLYLEGFTFLSLPYREAPIEVSPCHLIPSHAFMKSSKIFNLALAFYHIMLYIYESSISTAISGGYQYERKSSFSLFRRTGYHRNHSVVKGANYSIKKNACKGQNE